MLGDDGNLSPYVPPGRAHRKVNFLTCRLKDLSRKVSWLTRFLRQWCRGSETARHAPCADRPALYNMVAGWNRLDQTIRSIRLRQIHHPYKLRPAWTGTQRFEESGIRPSAAIGWRCSIARSYQSIAASTSERTR